jgi:hypothetical protein
MKTRIAIQCVIGVALTAIVAADDGPEEWFNHKRHAALKLECTYCHAAAEKGVRAAMPDAGRCLLCHKTMAATSPVLKRLVKLPSSARPFHAEYDNLPDYVIFSHARHARARLGCAGCHGNLWEQARTEPAKALNMKACVDCHKSHGAKVVCTMCHELGQ